MHQIWICSWTRVLYLRSQLVRGSKNLEDYRFLSGSSIHTYWGSFWIFILKTVISQLDCHPNNKHDIFSNPEKRPGRDTYIFACYLVTRLIFALFFLFLLLLFSVLARVASIDKQWIGIKNYMSRYHLPLATSTSLGEVFSMKTAPYSPAPSIYIILHSALKYEKGGKNLRKWVWHCNTSKVKIYFLMMGSLYSELDFWLPHNLSEN